MLSISLLYYYYKVNIFLDIIILVSSTIFQNYDIISHASLFKKNQQFIIQDVIAVYNSYVITTYIKTKQKKRK